MLAEYADNGGAPAGTHQHRSWSLWLLLIAVIPVAIPAFYSRIHPMLAGIPFFIWYQMLAVLFGGIVTGIVYVLRGTEKSLKITKTGNSGSDEPQ